MNIPDYMDAPDLELGGENYLWFHSRGGQERSGAEWGHPNKETGVFCLGGMNFSPGGWTVESWEPFTCSPSLLCSCGAHGFIRDGKWVPA